MNRSQPATLFLRPVTADDLVHDLYNNVKFSEYSKYTRSDPMTYTGPDRWLYNHDRPLPTTGWVKSLRYTKIHGHVLWHLPVTTGCFIIRTGHCRRLYIRFTQLGQVLQNTLKIHGRVLWLLPVTTDYLIYVLHKNWGSGRPASVSNTPTPAVLCPPSGL